MYLSNIYYESKMLGAFAHGPVQAIWIFKFRGLLWCHHQYNCHVFHVEDHRWINDRAYRAQAQGARGPKGPGQLGPAAATQAKLLLQK